MNESTPHHSPASPPSGFTGRRNNGVLRAALLPGMVILFFALAFASPVLAANYGSPVEQGTVPLPPPGSGGQNDDDSSEGEEPPTATSTPVPIADASAQQSDPAGAAAYSGVVTSPRLNVRSGPGVAFASLGQHLQNAVVTVQYRDESGDWWYTCCISGTTTSGWSSAAFIRTDFATAEGLTLLPVFPEIDQLAAPTLPATTVATPATPRVVNGELTAVVDAQPRLIVRESDGTNGAILGRISDGATVEVIARNAAGDWWYICCIDGSETEGWANAAFLVPNFDAAQANRLIPIFGAAPLQLPTPTPRGLPVITKMPKLLSPTQTTPAQTTPTPVTVEVPTAAATATPMAQTTPTPTAAVPAATPAPTLPPAEEATATPVAAAPTTLEAVAWQEPAFAAPGDTVLLRYLITNTGTDIAREVKVRNELPAELVLHQGAGSPNAIFDSASTDSGATVYSLLWDEVPAGESVSATVAVTLDPALAHGSVIFNLAAVGALNAAAQTAAITISTPPVGLPNFQ